MFIEYFYLLLLFEHSLVGSWYRFQPLVFVRFQMVISLFVFVSDVLQRFTDENDLYSLGIGSVHGELMGF